MVRVFDIDGCDWWIGDATPEEILKDYCNTTLRTEDEVFEENGLPRPLSEKELDTLDYIYDDGKVVSFRKAMKDMIESGEKFPCIFASREF